MIYVERGFIALMWAIILFVIIGSVKTALSDERFVEAKDEDIEIHLSRQPLFPSFQRERKAVVCRENLTVLITHLRPRTFHLQALTPSVDRELLISILRIQESQRDPFAIGDKGKAFGCLQIHQCVVIDVNRKFGTSYRHKDILGNPKLAKEICLKYWQIYASPTASYEELARLWNGGPDWRKDPSTIRYWNQVKQLLTNRLAQSRRFFHTTLYFRCRKIDDMPYKLFQTTPHRRKRFWKQ